MKRWLRVLAAVLAAGMLGSLCGCAASRRVRASVRAARTVATAGDVKIRYDEVYYLANNYIAERRAASGEDVMASEAERTALRAFVEENLVNEGTALRAVAADYGISPDEGDVADEVQAYMDDLLETDFGGDRKAYIASLDAAYLTDHYVRTQIATEEFLPTAVVKVMIEKGELDTTDAAARALIDSDNFIRTIQVFVQKVTQTRSEAESRAAAAALHDEIAGKETAEERYAAMRKAVGGKYNNDFGDTGNGYYFARGEMNESYEAVAFALAEYDVSDVVETADGFYLIMRLPKDAAYIEQNFQTLKEKSYFITLNVKVEEKRAAMPLAWNKAGAALDLADLPVIHANGGAWVPVALWTGFGLVLAGVATVVVLLVRRATGGKKRAKKQK